MYLEKLVAQYEFNRSVYYDASLPDTVSALLDFSTQLSGQLGGRVIVLSVSRPDNNGLRRIFLLFSGDRKEMLDIAELRWCRYLGVSALTAIQFEIS